MGKAPQAAAEKVTARTAFGQPGGAPSISTAGRVILDAVGDDLLADVLNEYLELHQTSASVYELATDSAFGVFAPGWCHLLDAAAHECCALKDPQGTSGGESSGCHQVCSTEVSRLAIDTGEPADIECHGGIRLYAVPIRVGGEIVGSINFGYGDPPKDPRKLREIAERFQVSVDELRRQSESYESRPPALIDMTKRRLLRSARLIGALIENRRTEDALAEREQQAAAIAELGALAVSGAKLTTLFDVSVSLISKVLRVEHCKVLELLPGGEEMLLLAGAGWKRGMVGQATVPSDLGSQAGYTLRTTQPVIVEDLRTDERFSAPQLLLDHEIVSGMSVLIGPTERPWGVLGVHTTRHRDFGDNDTHFLRSAANLLADTIMRTHVEKELANHRDYLEELVEERTSRLRKAVDLMAGREIRMVELKEKIVILTKELAAARSGAKLR